MPRPTTYTPSLAETVIAHLSKGLSLSAFAAEHGINRVTLYKWRARHPDFDQACATKPTISDDPVPVTLRPAGAIIFSLAAWGLPLDLAHSPRPTLTEDEVDDRLWEQTVRAA